MSSLLPSVFWERGVRAVRCRLHVRLVVRAAWLSLGAFVPESMVARHSALGKPSNATLVIFLWLAVR